MIVPHKAQAHHLQDGNKFHHTINDATHTDAIAEAAQGTINAEEFSCLAYTTYVEAGGTSNTEKQLVADVIINRTRTHLWGKNICETVLALHPKVGKPGRAFPWTQHTYIPKIAMDSPTWHDTIHAARLALTTPDISKGATFFAQKNVHTEWTTARNYIPTFHTRHHYYRPPLPIDDTPQVADLPRQPRQYAPLIHSPYTDAPPIHTTHAVAHTGQ